MGAGTRAAIANHVEHLIRPNQASVYVTVDATNWCAAPRELVERFARHGGLARKELESVFCAQVRAAFAGLWEEHVSCGWLQDEDAGLAHRYQANAAQRFGPTHGGFMRSWYLQAARGYRANAFRRLIAAGRHEFIVRARFDLRYHHPVQLRFMPVRPPAIYALTYAVDTTGEPHEAYSASISTTRQCWRHMERPHGESDALGRNVTVRCPDNSSTRVLWRDWLYVGNEEAMDVLDRMGLPPYRMHLSDRARCYGMCPEEQTVLHLAYSHVALKELSWRVDIAPPTCEDASWLRPLVNRSTAHLTGSVADHRGLPCSKFVKFVHGCRRKAELGILGAVAAARERRERYRRAALGAAADNAAEHRGRAAAARTVRKFFERTHAQDADDYHDLEGAREGKEFG